MHADEIVVVTTSMNDLTTEAALAALGFSDLESRIYCALLQSGGATGYGVAKAIGRPGANVYQAIGTLRQKGALLLADASAKTYVVQPPEELLAVLARNFEMRLTEAADALQRVEAAPPDDLLYQMSSVDQVYERARAMIARAEHIILFDLFPEPFSTLKPDLLGAIERGVLVAGLVYQAVESRDASWALRVRNADDVNQLWPGQGAILVADARQHLVSLISRDGSELLNGVWSDSPYLACVQHSGLNTEIRLHMLLADHPDPWPEISLFDSGVPGLTLLAARATAPRASHE